MLVSTLYKFPSALSLTGSALNDVTNKFDDSGPPNVRQVGVAVGKLIFVKTFSFFTTNNINLELEVDIEKFINNSSRQIKLCRLIFEISILNMKVFYICHHIGQLCPKAKRLRVYRIH